MEDDNSTEIKLLMKDKMRNFVELWIYHVVYP